MPLDLGAVYRLGRGARRRGETPVCERTSVANHLAGTLPVAPIRSSPDWLGEMRQNLVEHDQDPSPKTSEADRHSGGVRQHFTALLAGVETWRESLA